MSFHEEGFGMLKASMVYEKALYVPKLLGRGDKKEGISSCFPTLQELGNRECLWVFSFDFISDYGVFHKS